MEDLLKIWCRDIKYIPNILTSESFFNEFNNQLRAEFYTLTHKIFDEKRWYLFIADPSKIEYNTNAEIPFARLKAELMFIKSRIPVSIIWINKVDKILYKPSANVQSSNLKFHWENLDLKALAIINLPDNLIDIRNKYNIYVNFPIYVMGGNLGTEPDLEINLISANELKKLKETMKIINSSWNQRQLESETRGFIHSLRFINIKDDVVTYSFDASTSDHNVYKYLFEELEKSEIGIKSIEILNG